MLHVKRRTAYNYKCCYNMLPWNAVQHTSANVDIRWCIGSVAMCTFANVGIISYMYRLIIQHKASRVKEKEGLSKAVNQNCQMTFFFLDETSRKKT